MKFKYTKPLASVISILCLLLITPLYSNAQGYIAASTYIGGSQLEQNPRLVVANGESYIMGNTISTDYPKTIGNAYGGASSGQGDVVITKLSANGTIIWSRYIGGSRDELWI